MLWRRVLLSPVVTIDVMPADAPAEYAPAMVTACSQGLAAGTCALAKATPESETPEAVALVIWQGNQFLQVTVRVARHGSQWTTRKLTFTARDRLLDRWTTVGLTVATLVGEGRQAAETPENDGAGAEGQGGAVGREPEGQGAAAQGAEGQGADASPPGGVNGSPLQSAQGNGAAHEPPKEAAPMAPKSTPARPRPAAASKLELQIALGGLLGSGWQEGGPSRGVWVHAMLGLAGTPFVAEGFASYSLSNGPRFRSASELRSNWSSVALGVGLASTLWPLNTRVACLLEAMFRHVDAELDGAHASDNELPLRLRGVAAWPSRSRVAALLGGAVQLPLARARSGGESATHQSLLVAEIQAGVELRF